MNIVIDWAHLTSIIKIYIWYLSVENQDVSTKLRLILKIMSKLFLGVFNVHLFLGIMLELPNLAISPCVSNLYVCL